MLSTIAINEEKPDSDVYFARLPSIDLDTCVDFIERTAVVREGEEDLELATCLQDRHDLTFNDRPLGTRPFWHLKVLHSPSDPSTFTAVWFFHHALGDGGCGPIFHCSLLAALNDASANLSSSEPANPIVTSSTQPILPPFESLHPHPISWPFFLRTILGSIFPSIFDHRPQHLWTGPPVSAPNPLPKTRVQFLTLSAPTTTQLLRLSRENKTTLQATLECSIATSLLTVLPAETYDKVVASGPISVRSILRHNGKPLDDNQFALAVSEYTHTHIRGSTHPTAFPWDDARAVRSTIQTELAKKGTDNPVSLLRYVSDMHKFYTEKIGKERKVSFELSNLGLVKVGGGKQGGWEVGRCVFSQTPNITGPPVVCSAVTGGDGCCVLTFTWLEGVLGEEMVGAVVEGVKRTVEGLVSGRG